MGLESVDEILDFAIEKEEEAVQFYTDLAAKMDMPHVRKMFEGFAGEERGHKAKLQRIKEGKLLAPAAEKVMDLKIADYSVEVETKPDMDYQDALILAMRKEKAAFRLYTDLAAKTDDENLRTSFQILAQEEAKHKLRFEIEYDEHVLTDN